MIANEIDPNNPIHLDEVAQACELARILRFAMVCALRLADGQPAHKLDETLGDAVQATWALTPHGTQLAFIDDALGAIREAKHEQLSELFTKTQGAVSRTLIDLRGQRDDNVLMFIAPQGHA